MPETPAASRPHSLRWRLTALVLGAVVLVWLATALFTYRDARRELHEVLDAHLAQSAALLIAQTSHELEEIETEHAPLQHRYARRVAFQVWEDGELRLHSRNAPDTPLGGASAGFSERDIGGTRWRVYSEWDDDHHFQVMVGEPLDLREHMTGELAEHLLQPLALALPLLALLIWHAVRRGLAPLSALAAQVATRDPGNLAPLAPTRIPSEVQPLVDQLNTLFGRIGQSLEQERRFTADAAHELRTPLAGIRAQAQVARAATDATERQHALDATIAGCDRATHLVEQLLTLARVDSNATQGMESVHLARLAAEVLAELAPAALDKGIEVTLQANAAHSVTGQPAWLRILLRNLVDNAVRYSPPGNPVQVRIDDEGDKVILRVEDRGPGIPGAERDKVLQRFYRVLGSGETGSGLGLSIAARIAALHHARLTLDPCRDGIGLCVSIDFPAGGETGQG